MRTIPNISHLFVSLENTITSKFIPCLLKQNFNNTERKVFSLPAKYGGLGIFDPSEISQAEYDYSTAVTGPLVDIIYNQCMTFNAPSERNKSHRIMNPLIITYLM